MSPKNRDRRSARRGAAVVEVTLVLGMLVTVVLGVFEFGRIVMLRQLLNNAAREGARLAIVGSANQPQTTTADVVNLVNSYLAGQSIDGLTVQVYQADPTTGNNLGDWSTTPYGQPIAVRIDATYVPMLPITLGVIPNPLPLSVVSMMNSEAN